MIATYAEMGKVLPWLEEAVVLRPMAQALVKPLERDRMMAALHDSLAELRKMHERPGVMNTPRDQFGSILQSTFAEMAEEAGRVKKAKGVGTLEAKFDKTDPGWVTVAWEKLKAAFKGQISYVKPGKAETLPPTARVAIFGDWATGLYGAPGIGQSIDQDPKKVDVVLHLGDTYYSGTDGEFGKRFVPFWPERTGSVSRALNGNHEMYSGGKAYLKTIRERFGQKSTVFAMENDRWVLVGMDTALVDHDLNDAQVKWLKTMIDAAGDRKIVLFSHHQPFSRLDSQGPKLVEKLGPWLKKGKIFGWYWGHEHHCVLYEKHPAWKMWGRCVGHGGIPEFRDPALGKCPPKPAWRSLGPAGEIPACAVLDGPNEFIRTFEKLYSPHGYAVLTFDADRLTEEVRDAHGQVLRTTTLT